MYENADLDAAVKAGIFPAEATEKFRSFTAKQAGQLPADDEHFRLSRGFSDILASVGIVLLFFSLYVATRSLGPLLGLFYVPTAWLLAEYFVQHRKMLLPGFLLLVALIGGGACGLLALWLDLTDTVAAASLSPLGGMVISGGMALLCWLYWLRFGVPIACAAMALALYNIPGMVALMVVPGVAPSLEGVLLLSCGIATFAAAMWWDMTDVYRQTRRADVAFWLHGLAALVIANVGLRLAIGMPVNGIEKYEQLRSTLMSLDTTQAFSILALYAVFAIVSLITDRRALIVSGLVFAFAAFATLSGAREESWPVLFGAVAMAMLILSAAIWWTSIRRSLVNRLPLSIRAQLPRTELQRPRSRPIA